MEGKAYVDGKLACEATLTCAVVPRQSRGHAEPTTTTVASQTEPAEAVAAE